MRSKSLTNQNPPDVVELGKSLFYTIMGMGDYNKATDVLITLGLEKTHAQIIVSAICQALIEGSKAQHKLPAISPN